MSCNELCKTLSDLIGGLQTGRYYLNSSGLVFNIDDFPISVSFSNACIHPIFETETRINMKIDLIFTVSNQESNNGTL